MIMKPGKYSTLAAAFAALLSGRFHGLLHGAEACSCLPDQTLCDTYREADLVMHARAISRVVDSSSSDIPQYADVTYTVEVITTYKDDGGISGEPLSFTTTASSSLCGISLEIGGGDEESPEYLLDLRRIGSTDELRAVGLCGAFKEWSDDDAAILEGGCASTPVPAQTSVQAILDESDPDDSSALRLMANRGVVAAVAWLVSLYTILSFIH
ncbi:unnamed protein product [Ectocarpus sp. 12 AP-2014]